MEIEYKHKECLFDDIAQGTVFIIPGTKAVYMKTKLEKLDDREGSWINAVYLANGNYFKLEHNSKVQPVNAKLVIE